jgi:hypothetical protein
MEELRQMTTADRHRIAAIQWLLPRVPAKFRTKLHLLKLLYLADRFHLRKFGRTILEDTYYAMPRGPVASATKRILEGKGGHGCEDYLSAGPRNSVVSHQEIGAGLLSQSDVEALSAAINQIHFHPDLVGFTHMFPEWKRAEQRRTAAGAKRERMDIMDFFLPAPSEAEYCDADEELVSLSKEFFIPFWQ